MVIKFKWSGGLLFQADWAEVKKDISSKQLVAIVMWAYIIVSVSEDIDIGRWYHAPSKDEYHPLHYVKLL